MRGKMAPIIIVWIIGVGLLLYLLTGAFGSPRVRTVLSFPIMIGGTGTENAPKDKALRAQGAQAAQRINEAQIIPDSELVFGPSTVGFDINRFVKEKGGYLAQYKDRSSGAALTGAQVIDKVAHEYSVNPRLLLAILEYRAGWVTSPEPSARKRQFPIIPDPSYQSLYSQLSYAAMQLNAGYYQRKNIGVKKLQLPDGSRENIPDGMNPGSVGVMNLFGILGGGAGLGQALAPDGFPAVYTSLFGDPFANAVVVTPPDLKQPELALPFAPGDIWRFTGGPHPAWAPGSAWGALDFAPNELMGCSVWNGWVTAMADGVIVRTGGGAVVEDLDGDGNEQTGWTILYMHISSTGLPVSPGMAVKKGDPIGHPSCEGGQSTGTHTHLVRRYNGEWIPADIGSLRFNLDGWISAGSGTEYNGTLTRNGVTLVASTGGGNRNRISR